MDGTIWQRRRKFHCWQKTDAQNPDLSHKGADRDPETGSLDPAASGAALEFAAEAGWGHLDLRGFYLSYIS
jgi:hypothetical protein